MARLPLHLLLLLILLQVAYALGSSNKTRVPALLVFGDSLVDPGNNNVLPTIARSNFPPYGRKFSGQKPTGRFSNGKLPSDFLASALGLKELLPAYLDPQLKPQDLLTGVSFASAGTGYDERTANFWSVISVGDQLKLFKEYMEKLKAVAGEETGKSIVSRSLYVVCAGSNDMLFTYFENPINLKSYDVDTYIGFLLDTASTFVQELYRLGARKIAVAGLPPLGCLPSQRTLAGGILRKCVDIYNEAAVLYNSKLTEELHRLGSMLAGSTMPYIDLYSPVYNLIANPSAYGFEEVSKGCCGTGKLEFAILCNRLNPETCEDDSKYLFWDSYHPTEKASDVIVEKVFKKLEASL
ncbi:GDSL esterase/lipase EXL3-like [Aristolochia californica]|uniref:GDSL esterase/lipase EXL3-like n=1 Tax=Aristolochia californica TaxID=171875 RepID=UPI0035D9253F